MGKVFLMGSLTALLALFAWGAERSEETLDAGEIRIRDPFILSEGGTYYLYASRGPAGVMVYRSEDLKRWKKAVPVMDVPKEWGCSSVWAPEVHRYGDSYYLFVTLSFVHARPRPKRIYPDWKKTQRRGTWIFRSKTPLGPFKPLKNGSHTPESWMALDGTLCVQNGKPYMVFCHEWVQVIDGTVERVALKEDLSDIEGRPVTLFAASSAQNSTEGRRRGRVTDGPFLFRSKNGNLFMIWSTFLKGRYCVLVTRSRSGRIEGPWGKHSPLFTGDGGHGMIFRDKAGRLLMALHAPNGGNAERLKLVELAERGDTLARKTGGE